MISTILTIIGSIGGFITIFYGIEKLIHYTKSVYAGRTAKNHRFYFKNSEVSCRWLNQGKKYVGIRKNVIVSNIEGLEGFRVGMGPSSLGKFIITKGDLRIINAPTHDTEWVDYMCEITPSLRKGESKVVSYEYEAESNNGKVFPEFWMMVSESRCDKLLLRVVFEQIPTNEVIFTIEDRIGEIQSREKLEIDSISNECRKEIPYTRPGLIYKIDWSPKLGNTALK